MDHLDCFCLAYFLALQLNRKELFHKKFHRRFARIKPHCVQLKPRGARLEHKLKMAKFVLNIHQHPAVRSLVPVSVAFIVSMPVVIIIVAITATERGDQ